MRVSIIPDLLPCCVPGFYVVQYTSLRQRTLKRVEFSRIHVHLHDSLFHSSFTKKREIVNNSLAFFTIYMRFQSRISSYIIFSPLFHATPLGSHDSRFMFHDSCFFSSCFMFRDSQGNSLARIRSKHSIRVFTNLNK